MANKKKDMREASNRRMLDAALTEFAENGYSRALLGNIAKNAGVSNGMVTQRFKGKENLYNSVFLDIISTYLSRHRGDESLYGMLTMLVEDIKHDAAADGERFIFLSDLLLSKDAPVSSTEQAKALFESSYLCRKLKEGIKDGYIVSGEPFEIMKSFLVSVVGITKYFTEFSVALPETENYMALLSPKDSKTGQESDLLYKKLSNELIGHLATDYEAVYLINLETGRTVVGKAARAFRDCPLADPALSLDERVSMFANDFIGEEDRKRFMETIRTENLSEKYGAQEKLTVRFRSAADSYYQTAVGFTSIIEDGHWISLAFRNIDRQVRDEVRRALAEAERRKESIIARLSGVFDFIAYFDTVEDKLNIYKLQGDFQGVLDQVPKTTSGSRDMFNILTAVTAVKEREEVCERVRKIVQNIRDSSDRIKFFIFNATVRLRVFRCLIEVAALGDSKDSVVVGLVDFDKWLEVAE